MGRGCRWGPIYVGGMSSTRLLLVRHGQSEWNAAGRWQGQADPALTDLGRQQAREASRSIGKVDAIVSSPLIRARETAEIIAEELGVGPVIEVEALAERNAGAWSGLTRDEIEARYPGYLAEGRRPPGWEPDESVRQRALGGLDALVRTFGAGEILCVTHGGVLLQLEAHLGGAGHRHSNLSGRWIEHQHPTGFRLGPRLDLLAPELSTDGSTSDDQV